MCFMNLTGKLMGKEKPCGFQNVPLFTSAVRGSMRQSAGALLKYNKTPQTWHTLLLGTQSTFLLIAAYM